MSEQTKTKSFETSLTKINNTYFPMIENQLIGNGIQMDDYAKQCVFNAISSINQTLDTNGIKWQDPQLDQSNITQTLLNVASLKLNASANPSEVYFQLRNVKITRRENGQEKTEWKKQIEMGIEGDGNDAILARFGRDVKQVMQHWLVRENDDFEYPSFNGLEMSPPKWQPKGTGKVVKIVYPIIKKNDIVEYHIAEREDVIKNLIAHINNNLMNETFGIAKNRFNATAEQKAKINAKKKEIINRVKELGLDEALEDEDIQQHISPAWKDEQSKESMIIRKMRNNIVKKIPKDFGNTLVELSYDESTGDTEHTVRQEINENANREIIDIETEETEPIEVEREPIESEVVEVDDEEITEETQEQQNQQPQNEQPTSNLTKKEKAPF